VWVLLGFSTDFTPKPVGFLGITWVSEPSQKCPTMRCHAPHSVMHEALIKGNNIVSTMPLHLGLSHTHAGTHPMMQCPVAVCVRLFAESKASSPTIAIADDTWSQTRIWREQQETTIA